VLQTFSKNQNGKGTCIRIVFTLPFPNTGSHLYWGVILIVIVKRYSCSQ
jgi:hypothetical protein